MRKLVTYDTPHEVARGDLMVGDVIKTAVGQRSVEHVGPSGIVCDYPRHQVYELPKLVTVVGRVEEHPKREYEPYRYSTRILAKPNSAAAKPQAGRRRLDPDSNKRTQGR